jgi:cyclic beta-1,2-glucan synthetase
LYSLERLEQYASLLAAEHQVSAGPRRGKPLLPRLEENSRKLIAAYRVLAEAVRHERSISPAAEWLVDNFHIVEEQLREIREDLPRSYYYELPKLEAGDLVGYPRIYAIALALIAHTDSRLEIGTMKRFIRAYQNGMGGVALSIGELWAFAIVLRLALVENLRRLASRTIAAREAREEADALADKVLEMAGRQPNELGRYFAEWLSKRRSIAPAFVVQITRRLRDQDPAAGVALDHLEQQLQREGRSAEQIVHQEHQRQAAAQITVANVITSMRLLSTLDWRDFFESVSLVDRALEDDPAGAYARMDFTTRDCYRHVIERISKQTQASEPDVAQRAVKMAARAQRENPQDERRSHVGYYLIDRGLAELENAFACRPRFGERLRRAVLRHPTVIYLGALSFLTTAILAALAGYAFYSGAGPLALAGLIVLVLVPASELALSILNWAITSVFKPRLLPKIDISSGIPEDARTMVVIPTLLTDEAVVRELLERIEVHFLANQDGHLFFALLGDLPDAPREVMPDDEKLIGLARHQVAELNARYGGEGQPPRFYFFSRRRRWNPCEGKWICWERKRGNLHEFNRWLHGAGDTSFAVSTGDQESLKQIHYVITLDADTQLPRDTARRLVGTIVHPLNRARFDERAGRVTEGYGILQPRVQVSPTSAAQSRFAHIFSGNTGVDPYTTAVSDVYQDLFGEGSYTGKGLYDIDAFEAALASRVPENTLLSHDLFEGLFARAALVTDVELLDDYPSRYDAYAKRLHRWTRGDWQIARWLLPSIPDVQRGKVRNTLPPIARWKILDNLRRSLVAPTVLLLLVAAWTVLPGSAVWWTLFILIAVAFPVFAPVTASVLRPPRGIEWRSHVRSIWNEGRIKLTQGALTIIFLAHQAYLMADAVTRTLHRRLVSHQHLLEWVTAACAGRNGASRLIDFLRFM